MWLHSEYVEDLIERQSLSERRYLVSNFLVLDPCLFPAFGLSVKLPFDL